MLRNNADARRCSYFELRLPVLTVNSLNSEVHNLCGSQWAVTTLFQINKSDLVSGFS